MSFIVKNTTFPNLLDLIAPHSCRGCGCLGEALCPRCKNYILAHHQNICPNCRQEKTNGFCKNCPSFPETFVLGLRTDLIDVLIHEYKYKSVRALAKPLAELLHSIIPPLEQGTIIVPLPTISRHIRERGLDHTALIAKHLAKLHCIKHSPILLRNNNSIQVGADKATRLSQADSAYIINPKYNISPETTYVLFDDVWTTGASMMAAVKKLRKAGADKIVIALLGLSQI